MHRKFKHQWIEFTSYGTRTFKPLSWSKLESASVQPWVYNICYWCIFQSCGVMTKKVMAILADFMLVYLPAPTVALRAPLAINAGPITKFFHNCPDNAFQVALSGTSYSLVQRIGAILRNGSKAFCSWNCIITGSDTDTFCIIVFIQVGTAVTNALINAKKVVDKSSAGEIENVPILSTSAAYGVYMAVSSNLR
ncbi:hypothetical protein RIF29_15553 [Crotalaria pallida]|uniref:Uncharacterized protein n=1 Tax=Crotalaria pallida TaxID=3830 RepID=A0AAN9IBA0_CROPI